MNATLKTALKRVAAGQSAIADVQRTVLDLRDKLAVLDQQLEAIDDHGLPQSELDARIAALVQRDGAAYVDDRGNGFVHGERSLVAPCPVNAVRLPVMPWEAMPWGLVCAAAPELAATLLRGIVARVPYREGLPLAERPDTRARLLAERHELAATEERFIDDAAAAGLAIDHRPEVVARRQADADRQRREAKALAAQRQREAALDARHQRARRFARIR